MAPSLVTLVVGLLEETKLYPQIEDTLGIMASAYLREIYKRFLE